MSNTFTRKSATEWVWQKGSKHYSVRYFASTQRLVWSGWMQTNNAPEFDAGFAQSTTDFLDNSAPETHQPPQALLDDLLDALETVEDEPKRGGLFRWFRR